jgi:hypothetical protein
LVGLITTRAPQPLAPIALAVYNEDWHREREYIMTVAEEIKHQLHPGKLFIDGRREDAQHGGTIDVVNPATGELLTTVPDGQAGDVDRAVAAARASFERKSWRGITPAGCARCMVKPFQWMGRF